MRERTGTIDRLDDGRFRVRLTIPGRGRRVLGYYGSENEAERERTAALEIIDAEVPDDCITLREYGARWLERRDVNRLVKDPESDWSRWRNHIEVDPLARLTIRAVRRRHVREWIVRTSKRVARQTTLNALNVVRGILAAAVEDELIKVNPADGIKLPREKRTDEPWTFATLGEQWALVLAAPEPERWLIAFAFGTGLRAGELASLRLADVHEDRIVVRYGGPPNEATKGGKIRVVPLFGFGAMAARTWLAALPKWAKRNPNALMFPRLRGAYRDEIHILPWSTWQGIIERAGITRRFRWHDLRHTCGSSLVSGLWGRRWSLIEVRDMLGHESVTTTERYAHLAGTALEQAAAEAHSIGMNGYGPAVASGRNPQRIRLAPPAEIESATFGLGSPGKGHEMPAVLGDADQLRTLSIAYLKAVADGDPGAHRLGVDLATAVIESTQSRVVGYSGGTG